ncbi:MAG: hypothetical protein AAB778_00125 [Patescibacteria group bacterium]
MITIFELIVLLLIVLLSFNVIRRTTEKFDIGEDVLVHLGGKNYKQAKILSHKRGSVTVRFPGGGTASFNKHKVYKLPTKDGKDK